MDWGLIWQGALMTLWLTFASAILSLLIGIIIAVMRISDNPILSSFATAYTEFFRNIPLLLVLFFIYFGLPLTKIPFLVLSPVACAIWGFGLYTAAYTAEVIRAGFNAVSKGNIEASRSLGLTFLQSIWHVQLPQALRTAIPPLGTLLIALLKNTSLAGTITVAELVFQAEYISNETFNPDVLLWAGVVYLALTLPIAALVNFVEHRWAIKR